MEIRKMKDGILLLSKNKSDAVVKTDLAGNMIWKTNLGADAGAYRVQLVNNHIVLYASLNDEYSDHFIAIDSETGAVLADVISLEAVDYYYGGELNFSASRGISFCEVAVKWMLENHGTNIRTMGFYLRKRVV